MALLYAPQSGVVTLELLEPDGGVRVFQRTEKKICPLSFSNVWAKYEEEDERDLFMALK